MSTQPQNSNSANNKRIAKNTLVLYVRMLFLMAISLYTSRVILDALGVEDYGIYNVVGGFVAMFGLISAALTSACTRFINFEMGRGANARLNIVFSTTVTIQVLIAVAVAVIAETIGLWYINTYLVVTPDRLHAANWCYQFSVITFCTNLITVPYNASIVAHEKMKAFAYVGILEGIAKLGISFLIFIPPFDKLIYYGLLLCILQWGIRLIYRVYCRRNFEECAYHFILDKPLLKEMLSFSIWQFLGNAATILRTQGTNVLINFFYGPTLNAAKGIAGQVLHVVTGFSSNFMMAINPQITQTYAAGNYQQTLKLLNWGSKLSFFLLYGLSLPIVVNADYLLHIWLKEVPDYAIIFAQLSLILAIIENMMKPLMTAQSATGKVRNYMIVLSSISLLNLPLSWLLLHFGMSPVSIYIVAISLAILVDIARLIMLHINFPEFSPWDYVKLVILPCFLIIILTTIIPLYMSRSMEPTFVSFILNVSVCVVLSMTAIAMIGCSKEERSVLKDYMTSIKHKVSQK